MKVYEGASVLKFLSGNISAGDINMRCPSCGFDFTHIREVGTLMGQDEHEAVVYKGTGIIGKTKSRRSAIQIIFDCEGCTDTFALVIQQHKGNDFLQVWADIGPKNPQRFRWYEPDE